MSMECIYIFNSVETVEKQTNLSISHEVKPTVEESLIFQYH